MFVAYARPPREAYYLVHGTRELLFSQSLQTNNSARTARVWTNFSPTFELKGHENSVWDAVAIGEDEFITGTL
jgi:hypothetical protein